MQMDIFDISLKNMFYNVIIVRMDERSDIICYILFKKRIVLMLLTLEQTFITVF